MLDNNKNICKYVQKTFKVSIFSVQQLYLKSIVTETLITYT